MGISFEERLKALSYQIRGAAMEVYNQLGPDCWNQFTRKR